MKKHSLLLAVAIAFVSALAFTPNAHAQSRVTDVDVHWGPGGVSVDVDIRTHRGGRIYRDGNCGRRGNCGPVVRHPRGGCDRDCDGGHRIHRPSTILITVDWYVPGQRWYDNRRGCWVESRGYWTTRDVHATWNSFYGGYVWYDWEGRRHVR